MQAYDYKKEKKEPKEKALATEAKRLRNILTKYSFSEGDPERVFIEKQISEIESQIKQIKGGAD